MDTSAVILIFQLLYIITALGAMIIIISENRNPLKTISWVLVLLLLPLVGLFIYYFFGEDNRKKRLISKRIQKKLTREGIDFSPAEENINPPSGYLPLYNLLNREHHAPLYGGNKINLFSNGKDKFDDLIKHLKKAKHHIHIQYYVFMDDKLGNRIKDVLIEKANEGVQVRLIYDDVGSWTANRRFFKNMEEHGIEVQPYLKVAFRFLTSRVNYRNHRKVTVIDGKIGYVGGMNVADRYIEGLKFGAWRDCHLRIEGKAVAGLQISFLMDWYASRKELISSPNFFPKLENEGNNLIQLVTSGPEGQFKDIHLGILQAIDNAKEYVYIQTPYFIPTDHLLLSIQRASLRGVDVRLMVPKNSDTVFVQVATMSFLKEALDAKVKIYFYEKGFLHSKLMVIDGELTITGSANMDIRSFEHNFEINAFIYNEDTSEQAKKIFLKDMRYSSLVKSKNWENRSRIKKFKESIMRLFSPLL